MIASPTPTRIRHKLAHYAIWLLLGNDAPCDAGIGWQTVGRGSQRAMRRRCDPKNAGRLAAPRQSPSGAELAYLESKVLAAPGCHGNSV